MTVDGPVDVRIPEGTQPGQRLRLRGRGAVRLGTGGTAGSGGSGVTGGTGQRGDAVVAVQVRVKGPVSQKERELLEEIRRLRDDGEGKR